MSDQVQDLFNYLQEQFPAAIGNIKLHQTFSEIQSQLTASQARVKELEARQPLHPVIQMAAEPALQAELAKPLSIHSEHPPLSPCDHDDCLPTECVRNRDKERIATLEQALREAGTWARAEQAVIDCPEYSKQAQDDLRSKLKVPARFRTLGDYLDELRQKALATISTALNEKEGK